MKYEAFWILRTGCRSVMRTRAEGFLCDDCFLDLCTDEVAGTFCVPFQEADGPLRLSDQ